MNPHALNSLYCLLGIALCCYFLARPLVREWRFRRALRRRLAQCNKERSVLR